MGGENRQNTPTYATNRPPPYAKHFKNTDRGRETENCQLGSQRFPGTPTMIITSPSEELTLMIV